MKLNFKHSGEGKALVIMHGLFGSLDNWQTLGKRFAEDFAVYLVDLRNHGHSPHSDDWSYDLMCADLLELLEDNQLDKIYLLGHSLGGKVAMQFALMYPEKVEKLIVADIAPKYYPPHHGAVLAAIRAVNLDTVKSRKEAEEVLAAHDLDMGTRQFLLKNLYWLEGNTRLAWRFNVDAIERNIMIVGKDQEIEGSNALPCLFLRGSKSNYILDSDRESILRVFPSARIETIENAGHWLQAEKPEEFYKAVKGFLTEKG